MGLMGDFACRRYSDEQRSLKFQYQKHCQKKEKEKKKKHRQRTLLVGILTIYYINTSLQLAGNRDFLGVG